MFLLDWYREYRELKENLRKERSVCSTCEVLKQQIEALRYDNQRLLDALIAKETPTESKVDTSNLQPVKPRWMPFSQRRQMLQAEDRQAAILLQKKQQEMVPPTVAESPVATVEEQGIEELERELDIAGQEREQQTGTQQSA